MDVGYVKGENKSPPFQDETLYRTLIGALLYISVCAASATILGRNVCSPSEADWVAAKRVARYLKHTKGWRLLYNDADGELVGHSDADWGGDIVDRKSTTGFVFHYGGAAISWASRKQNCVTLSSMESEYVALSETVQELLWIHALLEDFGECVKQPVKLYEDNQSCRKFISSERSNRRSKHIETKEHFIRQHCEGGLMQLEYRLTEDMVADILTKPLNAIKQLKFSKMLGLSSSNGNVVEEEC